MSQYTKKRYNIHDVVPGMEIGETVLMENGKIALTEGVILNFSAIERLKYWGVNSVVIKEAAVAVRQEDPINLQRKHFFGQYDKAVGGIKDMFQNLRYFKEVPVQQFQVLADQIVESMVTTVGVVNSLLMTPRKQDYTFHHSVNVAVISGVLGQWLGYGYTEVKELILAGLLHDIGKAQIPLAILNKPGKLSAEEMTVMRTHSTLGYNLIKEMREIPIGVSYAVLQHHERMDGSGYPLQIKGDKIHPYARIIAVADIYDAMTSDRVYVNKTSPFSVAEMLVQEMFNKLDPSICTLFLNNVRDYFLGGIVQLSDGRRAEVIYLGQVAAARPVVRTEEGEFIDLEKRRDLGILSLEKEN
ncbi:hypothetical protein P22_0055 [Propionispora sp. 2/2-37]|uniref:HD-GYP domain-containing protein n=1 Tax=Propionispora sp. 2/2-37 TaxID=1677858 RepID=UPI0006BB6A66|nr:HD-GYP domain-containing protein [Propionispora sp. 2/2-37]CUH93993.1 hypothetical protein P22_0055 [Propionispora sp. 2/2-37]